MIRAGSLATPADGRKVAGRVTARATIAEAAPLFAGDNDTLEVVDAAGAPIGILDRAAVVKVLMEG